MEIPLASKSTKPCAGTVVRNKETKQRAMAQHLKHGQGWRIGWNPDADPYRGLIGTDTWAFELTEAEWEDFCRLALQLAENMAQMAAELMAEEQITCEVECDRLWLEADGYPDAYRLRVILLQGRGAEGEWEAEAVSALLQAIQTLRVF